MCFRLGLSLNERVPRGYTLDSEYNFDLSGDKSKGVPNAGRLRELAEELFPHTEQGDLRKVVPDFIFHKRTAAHADNLAIIEIKFSDASNAQKEFDREKVKALRAAFGYSMGVVVLVPRSLDIAQVQVRFAPDFQ